MAVTYKIYGTNQPYTGPVFSIFKDGSKQSEGNLKDGKINDEWIEYYSNTPRWWYDLGRTTKGL